MTLQSQNFMKKLTSAKNFFDFKPSYRKSVWPNFCGKWLKNIFGLFWTFYKQHVITFFHKQKFLSHVENLLAQRKMADSKKISYKILGCFVLQYCWKWTGIGYKWDFIGLYPRIIYFNWFLWKRSLKCRSILQIFLFFRTSSYKTRIKIFFIIV